MIPEVAAILGRAYLGGVDVSLRELASLLSLPENDVLGSCIAVTSFLAASALEIDPDISTGDFDMRRALRGISSALTAADMARILTCDESPVIEYKSTLVCDLKAYRGEPKRLARSDGVTHSALKTICAFANTGGGKLLIGVEDDRSICGLELDLEVMNSGKDAWENHFRSLISTKFLHGKVMNSFVDIDYVQMDTRTICVVEVIGRLDSTFLKHSREDRYEYYVRQGNRSTSLDIHEFEQHLLGRSRRQS